MLYDDLLSSTQDTSLRLSLLYDSSSMTAPSSTTLLYYIQYVLSKRVAGVMGFPLGTMLARRPDSICRGSSNQTLDVARTHRRDGGAGGQLLHLSTISSTVYE